MSEVADWIEQLNGRSWTKRIEAIEALKAMGPRASAALPALWKLTRSRDKELKARALFAISEIATDIDELRRVRAIEERGI